MIIPSAFSASWRFKYSFNAIRMACSSHVYLDESFPAPTLNCFVLLPSGKELEFTISPSKIRLKAQMSFEETKKHLWGSFDTVEASEEFDVLASIILNSFFSVRSKFS
ncbi:hypothetical protein TNCV_462511 [Trichonephila clavipes]|nr:hypothetical protein TNCV_462511 [Trichonephila clavipes]